MLRKMKNCKYAATLELPQDICALASAVAKTMSFVFRFDMRKVRRSGYFEENISVGSRVP